MARATEAATILLLWPQLNVFHCVLRVIVASSLRCERTTVRGAGGKAFRRGLSWRCFSDRTPSSSTLAALVYSSRQRGPSLLVESRDVRFIPKSRTFAAHKYWSCSQAFRVCPNPTLGQKQTCAMQLGMSAMGQLRTWDNSS